MPRARPAGRATRVVAVAGPERSHSQGPAGLPVRQGLPLWGQIGVLAARPLFCCISRGSHGCPPPLPGRVPGRNSPRYTGLPGVHSPGACPPADSPATAHSRTDLSDTPPCFCWLPPLPIASGILIPADGVPCRFAAGLRERPVYPSFPASSSAGIMMNSRTSVLRYLTLVPTIFRLIGSFPSASSFL